MKQSPEAFLLFQNSSKIDCEGDTPALPLIFIAYPWEYFVQFIDTNPSITFISSLPGNWQAVHRFPQGVQEWWYFQKVCFDCSIQLSRLSFPIITHPAFRHLGYHASVYQKISLRCPFFASCTDLIKGKDNSILLLLFGPCCWLFLCLFLSKFSHWCSSADSSHSSSPLVPPLSGSVTTCSGANSS